MFAVLPTETAFLNPCFSTVTVYLPTWIESKDVSSAAAGLGCKRDSGSFISECHDRARNDRAFFIDDRSGYARRRTLSACNSQRDRTSGAKTQELVFSFHPLVWIEMVRSKG